MKILALDTSGRACSAAVAEDETLLCEVYIDRGLTHSVTLLPAVEDCLLRAGIAMAEMDAFAAAVGPGSFTGLRIGVNTVKAMAQAQGKPVLAVSTMDALAANAAGTAGLVCPILDARNRQVYTALYRDGRKILADCALPIGELLEKIGGEDALFLGDGVPVFREEIQAALPDARFAPGNLLLQRAGGVCREAFAAWQRGEAMDAYSIKPNYLRESQAERMKKARQ